MVETTGRGTLGQQQQVMMQEQQQGRVTRSDRKKAVEEERRFETGKAEAERLRTEVFIDKNIEEQYDYTYYIPTRYLDRYGNPTREWIRMSEKDKEYAIKQYYNRNTGYETATRRGYLKQFTEQRTKTTFDPFTFEEYEEEYEKLSPDVQQFFSSPVEIKAEKQRQKEVDLGVAQTKIEEWQEKIAREEERKKSQDDWWDKYTRRDSYRRLSSERKEEEKARHYRRMRDYDNKIDEYRASIRYLQGEWGKIGEGYKLQDIISYAQDKAYYDWLRWDSKDNARYKFELGLAKNDESLMKNLETLGFKDKTKVSFTDYQKSADKFNKDLAYTQQLQKWAGQKGFENLPTFAQDKIRSSTGLPTGEIPTFDTKGKLVNVQSAVFGGVYSAKDYETKVVDYQNTIEQAGGIEAFNQQENERTYKEFREEELEKRKKEGSVVTDMPFKFIDTPIGYGSGMTINTLDTGKLLVPIDFGDVKTDGMGIITKGYDQILSKTGDVQVPIFVGAGGSIKMSDITSPIKEKLFGEQGFFQTKISKFQERDINQTKILENEDLKGVDEKYQGMYQRSFEDSSEFKSAWMGDLTFEQAEESFSKSQRANQIQNLYGKEYGELFSQKRAEWGMENKFLGLVPRVSANQWAIMGLGLGEGLSKMAVGVVPETYGEAVVNTALIYGGVKSYKLLGLVPSSLKTTAIGLYGSYGAYEYLKPTSSPEKRAMGLFIAGTSAFSLTKAGIKYMRTPTAKIGKSPIPPTTKTEAVGLDNVKIIDKTTGKVLSKRGVVYSEQKLSQVGVGGQRYVTSQKWRDLFNKYIAPLNKRIAVEHVGGSGMKSVLRFSTKPSTTMVKPYYDPLTPTPAKFMRVESIRGTALVKTSISGKERAMKLWQEYGASKYQADVMTRLSSPRVYEPWINKGVIIPSKDTARGIFSTEIRQPKLDLGGGWKTRAGQPIKDLIAFERKVIPSKQVAQIYGKDAVGFSENAMRFRTIGDKPLSQFEMTSGKAIGKASDIYKGEWKGFEYDWRKLGSIAQQRGSLQLNFGKDSWSLGIYDQSKMSAKGSYLIDSGSFKPAKVTIVGDRATKVSRTPFDTSKIDRVSYQIRKPSPAPKVSATDPTPKQFQATQGQTTQSEFYGQGMYEKTDSVGRMFATDSARSNLQVMQQGWMKAPLQVDFAPPRVNVGKMFEVQTMSQTALDVGLLTQVGLKMQQKTDQKQDVQLKTLLKQQLGLKQQVALRQDTQMKQAQTTATTLQAPSLYQTPISLKDPMFKTPTMPKMRNYFVPAKASQKEKVKSRIRQMKMKEIRFEGLLPDFTSRALGLSPKEVGGVGDAMREIRKIQTGLGIRTGARFKKSNNKRGNISEKNLLRGIAN